MVEIIIDVQIIPFEMLKGAAPDLVEETLNSNPTVRNALDKSSYPYASIITIPLNDESHICISNNIMGVCHFAVEFMKNFNDIKIHPNCELIVRNESAINIANALGTQIPAFENITLERLNNEYSLVKIG